MANVLGLAPPATVAGASAGCSVTSIDSSAVVTVAVGFLRTLEALFPMSLPRIISFHFVSNTGSPITVSALTVIFVLSELL